MEEIVLSSTDVEMVDKIMKLYDDNKETLKPQRTRLYVEKKKDKAAFYEYLQKKLKGPVQKGIPDLSQEIEKASRKKKNVDPVPEFEAGPADQQPTEQAEEDNTGEIQARKLEVMMLLSRDRASKETAKLMKVGKELDLDKMDDKELQKVEEFAGVAVARASAEASSKNLLASMSRIVEVAAKKPPGTVLNVVEKDDLLKEDVTQLLGRYIIGAGTFLRATILFTFDAASAVLLYKEEKKKEESSTEKPVQ